MLESPRKLAIMIANIVAATGVIIVSRTHLNGLPTDFATLLHSDHQWLLFICVLYLGSLFVAWRFRDSFKISMTRMLIWAVIGYLGISNMLDFIGENRDIAGHILNFTVPEENAHRLTLLRARLAVFIVIITMAGTSIAIGFETKKSDE